MENNKKKIINITIGCDPEVFLKEINSDKFISAIGLIGGSKKYPKPITNEGHFIQEDNVSAEFNIPPCKTAEEMVKHITFVKDYIEDTIAKPNGLIVCVVPSALFDPDQLANDTALEFGCDPDENAWTNETNEINRKGVDAALRVAGGHIHIGYDNPDRRLSKELIKAMDIFLAVPAILIDKDTRRRLLYGKAGAHRFKKFGVEHRTLSNFWIETPELISWVYKQVHAAVEFVNYGGIITNPEQIVEAINTNNIELAIQIVEDYRISLPENVPMLTEIESTEVEANNE